MTTSAPPDNADDRSVERALEAYLRAKFVVPCAAMTGLIDLMAEEGPVAARADDLARMRTSVARVEDKIDALLADKPRLAARLADREGAARLRHDLRTPIAGVIGYAELLIEETEEEGDAAATASLADVLDAARQMLDAVGLLAPSAEASEAGGLREQMLEVAQELDHLTAPDLARPVVTGRILLVDDTTAVLDYLSRRLAREGHTVETCESGEAALALTDERSFDLVLLDVIMPGLSGIEVLRVLKARAPELPVLVLSSRDDVGTIVRCLDDGADDFLTKPVNPTILRSRIASSLERKFLRDRERAVLADLRAERARSEALLHNVLPSAIVARLQSGQSVPADHFASVTVLFCDLVGFTQLTAALPPDEVLALLNELFSGFDRLAVAHGLEKIKTIGDAYMAAGGLPEPREGHAGDAGRMALAMPGVAAEVARPRGLDLALRIGLDTGPASAGIIGEKKFFYDVWGDTVNTASRMESLAEPGRVQISAAMRDALGPGFFTERRGIVEVKGKGPTEIWLLTGLREEA